eukprot:sb/3477766/
MIVIQSDPDLVVSSGERIINNFITRNRPNQEILVPDWLITSHVTSITSSDWLFTCFGRFLHLFIAYIIISEYLYIARSSCFKIPIRLLSIHSFTGFHPGRYKLLH